MQKTVAVKILATLGACLVWLPVLAPFALSLIFYLQRGKFILDYLMPAEMALFFLAGGALLLIGMRLSGAISRTVRIGFWTGAGALLLLSVLMPIVSFFGGAAAERAWVPAAVLLLVVYTAGVICTGAGAASLLRRLFRPGAATDPSGGTDRRA
jgi:hypothetical protein